ncbi:MAG: 30S ribosomal protein S6 [bacterium]|nr:30S ribosomal protein S6 [bacterium]
MAQYELAVVYHPDLEIDLDKASSKVAQIIKDAGGEIKSEDNWGKRKLAYKIGKQEHGLYVFHTLEMPAEGVTKVNNQLNITDEVIRFLITKPDLKAIAKAEALRKEKAEKAAARTSNDDDDSDDEE